MDCLRWLGSIVIVAATTTGCSDSASTDAALPGQDESTSADGSGEDEGTTDGPIDDGEGESRGDESTSSMDPEPASSGGGTDSDGAGCSLECGAGSCTFDDLGAETCDCAAGYAFNGATCVECVGVPSSVDLQTGDLRLRVTINGEPAPASQSEYGRITLRNRRTGDSVELGTTGQPVLTGTVLAGEYDVYYDHVAGSVVPANVNLRLGEIVAAGEVDAELDIPSVPITGDFAFDGAPAPASAGESGRVLLRDASSGGEFVVGVTNGSTYALNVAPGSYVAIYEAIGSGAVAPGNARSAFMAVDVDDDGGQVDFDIPTVQIAGTFWFDGLPAPDSPSESGAVSLRRGDDFISLGTTNGGGFSVRAIPASYDVVYEARSAGAVAPANSRAVVDSITAKPGQPMPAVMVDIATVALDGSFTFNGEPAPTDPTDDGLVVLRRGDDDEVVLGVTSGGAYSRRVVPGDYTVHYVQDSSRASAPRNTNAWLSDFVAEQSVSLDVDVPRATISGEFTVGGQAPPSSDYEDGFIYLRDLETGDSVLLGTTRSGAYAAPVVPGEYDIVYVADTAGGPLPANTGAVIGSVSVDGDQPVAMPIDVPSRVIAGSITVDRAAPPQTSQDAGDLYLIDARTHDQVYLATTFEGVYDQTLTPGDYLVNYRVLSSTGIVPINANANLGCWHIE